MPHGKIGEMRIPEFIEDLAKRYQKKGMTSREAHQRAEAEIVEILSASKPWASQGKSRGPTRSSSRTKSKSHRFVVKHRSEKEKREAAMRKPSVSKPPGQKRVRTDFGKSLH